MLERLSHGLAGGCVCHVLSLRVSYSTQRANPKVPKNAIQSDGNNPKSAHRSSGPYPFWHWEILVGWTGMLAW